LIRRRGRTMPKLHPNDFSGRVVEEVESGASRCEAAERYGLTPSLVMIPVRRERCKRRAATPRRGAARGIFGGPIAAANESAGA
jgi:hypothetical protein